MISSNDNKKNWRYFKRLTSTSSRIGCEFEFDVYILRRPPVESKVSPSRYLSFKINK